MRDSRINSTALLVLLFLAGCQTQDSSAPIVGAPTEGSSMEMVSDSEMVDDSTASGGPTGESQPEVIVADAAGLPIADATITGISLSISGQQTRTDRNGKAAIPRAIQQTKWITVGKPGYVTTQQISVDQAKPIRITLQRDPNAQ